MFDKISSSRLVTGFLARFATGLCIVFLTILVFRLKLYTVTPSELIKLTATFLVIRALLWVSESKIRPSNNSLITGFSKALFLTGLPLLAVMNSGLLKIGTWSDLFIDILSIFVVGSGYLALSDTRPESSEFTEIIDKEHAVAQRDENGSKSNRIFDSPVRYGKGFIASYKEDKLFYIPLTVITVLFLAIKFSVPMIFKGSFIDEYFHIFSGVELFHTGHFAEVYKGELYSRGFYISFLVGLYTKALGRTFFITKMVPASIGIANFVLLYLIARKVISNKYYIPPLLATYALSPWVIFNHFYIRIYSFYEFSVLLLTYLLLQNRYVLAILTATLFAYFDDFGAMAKMIGLYTLVSLYLKLNLYKYWKTNIVILFSSLALAHAQAASVLKGFFGAYLFYSTPNTVKYDTTILKWGIIIVIILIIFFCKLIEKPNKLIWLASIPGLLLLHLISPKSIQVNRAVLYIYPLLYLCVFYAISKTTRKTGVFISAIIFLSTVILYPHFFTGGSLGLPDEIAYMDIHAYLDAQKLCVNKRIYVSSRPGIATFYGLRPDYYINTKFEDAAWIAANKENGEDRLFYARDSVLYDTLTNTPIITSYSALTNSLSLSPSCIIMGGLPYSWVNDEVRHYIQQNYDELGPYDTNFESSRMRLFIERK